MIELKFSYKNTKTINKNETILIKNKDSEFEYEEAEIEHIFNCFKSFLISCDFDSDSINNIIKSSIEMEGLWKI